MSEQQAFYIKDEGYVGIRKVDNKILPIVVLKDPIAKKYSGFRLILKDLLTVKECISELRPLAHNGQASIQKQSLSFYAVVTYGKCFTESKGRGTKLDEKDSLKYASDSQKLQHREIMDERHGYVAHAGLAKFEHNPVVVSLNPVGPKRIIGIYDNLMSLVDIDSQLDEFSGLVDALIKYVKESCRKSLKKLEENTSQIDLEKLYAAAILPSMNDIQNIKTDNKK